MYPLCFNLLARKFVLIFRMPVEHALKLLFQGDREIPSFVTKPGLLDCLCRLCRFNSIPIAVGAAGTDGSAKDHL